MKTIYYRKVGRRYHPVYEYDQGLMDALPKGSHLVISYPGGQSRHYNIDPNYAAMIAAGCVAEDAICSAIVKASEIRPNRKALTQEEHAAWMNLVDVWGDEARSITRPAARDISKAGIAAMQKEADKLMTHPTVKLAFEKFLMVVELCSKKQYFEIEL